MILIKPSYEIMTPVDRKGILKLLELAGRVCYKSEGSITEDSCVGFVQKIQSRNHLSVIEHCSLTVKFVIDRGVSHELVRHRLCSFSQESTRYCNYSKEKFGSNITFVIPPWVNITPSEYNSASQISVSKDEISSDIDYLWYESLRRSEKCYLSLLEEGWTPQQARSVLPNSLKTEIVVTANLREWQHIFSLRCHESAHPQMREIMIPLRNELHLELPEIF
jgi:thymidylate synthase (FAD)